MNNVVSLGILLIFIGFILILASNLSNSKTEVKTAGVAFFGPIPLFGFGNDKKLLYLLFGLGILIFIIFELLKK